MHEANEASPYTFGLKIKVVIGGETGVSGVNIKLGRKLFYDCCQQIAVSSRPKLSKRVSIYLQTRWYTSFAWSAVGEKKGCKLACKRVKVILKFYYLQRAFYAIYYTTKQCAHVYVPDKTCNLRSVPTPQSLEILQGATNRTGEELSPHYSPKAESTALHISLRGTHTKQEPSPTEFENFGL